MKDNFEASQSINLRVQGELLIDENIDLLANFDGYLSLQSEQEVHYVRGTDSEVKLTITYLNGVLIETREVRVPASRIYTMNMSRYREGVYLLTAESATLRKQIKIIKR